MTRPELRLADQGGGRRPDVRHATVVELPVDVEMSREDRGDPPACDLEQLPAAAFENRLLPVAGFARLVDECGLVHEERARPACRGRETVAQGVPLNPSAREP